MNKSAIAKLKQNWIWDGRRQNNCTRIWESMRVGEKRPKWKQSIMPYFVPKGSSILCILLCTPTSSNAFPLTVHQCFSPCSFFFLFQCLVICLVLRHSGWHQTKNKSNTFYPHLQLPGVRWEKDGFKCINQLLLLNVSFARQRSGPVSGVIHMNYSCRTQAHFRMSGFIIFFCFLFSSLEEFVSWYISARISFYSSQLTPRCSLFYLKRNCA